MHRPLSLLCGTLGAGALLGAAGCVSLDPKPDIARAGATVQERSGHETGWDQAWTRTLEVWDGRSPLTVDQAVVTALKNNRELRGAVEEIGASRADLVQAGLLPNPVLSLALRFPVDPAEGYPQLSASVVQSFVALWLRPARVRAAEARLNESVLSLSDRSLRLVADVKASHARLRYGERGAAITEQSIAAAERLAGMVEQQRVAGASTPLAVNRARQQVKTLDQELRRRRRDLARERRELLELMGFASAPAEWTAADPAAPDGAPTEARVSEAPIPDGLTEDDVIRLATEQRLDVAASLAVARSLASGLTVEQRSRLAVLEAGASFEQTEGKARFLGPQVDVALPIFDTNRAQIAKAGSLARAALINSEAVAQRAVREARVAYIGATQAASAAEDFEHGTAGEGPGLLNRLRSNEQTAADAFRAGEITLIDWLDIVRERQDAMETLNDLRLEAAQGRIELEYAVGGRLGVPPADSAPEQAPAGIQEGHSHH